MNQTQRIVALQAEAEQGDLEAQYKLGSIYARSDRSKKDRLKSIYWFQKAADQGHGSAKFALGCAYAKGYVVTRDYSMAYKYYREAAEQGHDGAQLNLGILCLEGRAGIEREENAAAWFLQSAERGNAKAQANLGMHYLTGFGVERDKIIGLSWLEIASKGGFNSWPHRVTLCWSRLWLSGSQRNRFHETVSSLREKIMLKRMS